jgi:uroporphyrinogen-III synthase
MNDNGPAPPLLLLTRPEDASRRFARTMAETGVPHSVLIAPLTAIAPVAFDAAVLRNSGGFIATSAQALGALPIDIKAPVYCVGPGTTRAARARGLDARLAGQDAHSLLETLLASDVAKPLVHLHGTHLALDVVAALRAAGRDARGIQVYKTIDLTWDHDQDRQIADAARIVAPIFSPRGARALGRALGGFDRIGLITPAISAAAAPTPHSPIAPSPDHDGMVRVTRIALAEFPHNA